MGTGHQMYRPICLIKALQLNVQQILIWLEMLHGPKNNWFSRVKCIKRPYRHMFFLTEQHTRQKTNMCFFVMSIYGHTKSYKPNRWHMTLMRLSLGV